MERTIEQCGVILQPTNNKLQTKREEGDEEGRTRKEREEERVGDIPVSMGKIFVSEVSFLVCITLCCICKLLNFKLALEIVLQK